MVLLIPLVKKIWSNIGSGEKYLGILAPDGIYQESIFIPTDGEYEFKLILTGQYSNNFENFLVSTSNFEFNSQSFLTKEKTRQFQIGSKTMQSGGQLVQLMMMLSFKEFNS